MIVKYSDNIIITNSSVPNLSKTSTAKVPIVDFQNLLDQNKYYTLIMYDPDAPNIIPDLVHVHWIINNININNNNTNFNTLLVYSGPHPPPGSGLHRYIFNLYLQPEVFSENISINNDNRSISIPNLLDQLQLTNENLVSSVSFTCTSSSGGKKSKRRKVFKSKRRKVFKSKRRKYKH